MSHCFGPARFLRDARGGVAITAALVLPVLLLFVGASVDYSRLSTARTQLQSTADAAALDAARAATTSAATANMNKAFAAASHKSFLEDATVTPELVSFTPGSAEIRATVEVPMAFFLLTGQPKMSVGVSAAATVSKPSNAAKTLDVAMCIDATGSMQPVIDAVKNSAIGFAANLNAYFQAQGLSPFDLIRVRPIFFRDFGGNNPNSGAGSYDLKNGGYVDLYPNGVAWKPAGDSRYYGDAVPLHAAGDFYRLPAEESNFKSFVNPELESGGGDYIESGIECLNEAMDSNWLHVGDSISGGMKVDQAFTAIAIWTDEDAHPPGFSWSLLNANYPDASKMPRDYAGLRAKWDNSAKIPQAHKLLTFFKPTKSHPGWAPVLAWPNASISGTLTQGTDNMISSIGAAVATLDKSGSGSKVVHLTK